jgi:dye decolorizing peroxidase
MSESGEENQGTGRRDVLKATGVAAVAGFAGWALRGVVGEPPGPQATPTPELLPPAHRVPGVTSPQVPQRHLLATVISFEGMTSDAVLARVRAAQSARHPSAVDAGDITIIVGFAAHHAGQLWPERAVSARELPPFATDTPDAITGGDLALQVCAETASGTRDATLQLLDALGGPRVLWECSGYRDAPTAKGTARTNTGFIDGITNPRTSREVAEGVWTDHTHRDTFVVMRRMTVDAGFGRMPVSAQESAIGRHRDTGAPLSGGGPMAHVDLLAKTADGRLLTPLASHARRAHPSNIGRPLMLRRSYSFDTEGEGTGLIFTAFLSDPQTFILTQSRLEEMDDLIAHTTADASGCFFVPGHLDT